MYFDGCPSWRHALDALLDALRSLDQAPNICLVRVDTPEAAEAARFPGSPTLRLGGEDLFPASHDFGLGCRLYFTEDGPRGWPTQAMIEAAVRKRLDLDA